MVGSFISVILLSIFAFVELEPTSTLFFFIISITSVQVLFGAILSSFNSALNSCVTLYGVDIYKQFIDKEASDETVVKKGKTVWCYFGIFRYDNRTISSVCR